MTLSAIHDEGGRRSPADDAAVDSERQTTVVRKDEDAAPATRRLRRGTDELNGETLPAQIHGLLEEAIIRGELAPTSRLHPDEIATHYGVSRIPVREALRSLHEAGWVEIRPRYGVYVRDRSMTELRELFEARAGIEAHIAELAALHRDDEDLVAMRRIVRNGRAAAEDGDLEVTARASVDFNEAIRRACRNSVLAGLASTLEKRARFYFAMVEDRLGSDWLNIDRDLLQSIERGDGARAAETARAHILDTGAEVSKLLTDG